MMPKPHTPLLTADCVILDEGGRVLLIRRANPPYRRALALPGGFVETDETVEDACRREVGEETGLAITRLQLVGVYSTPGRDPRGPTATVAFLARVRGAKPVAGDDAAGVVWVSDWRRRRLAFDHATIIADAVKLARREVPAVRAQRASRRGSTSSRRR